MGILPELVEERSVSLEEVLLSREARQERQRAWISRYEMAIVSLTIVVPGEFKDTRLSRQAFNMAWQALDALSLEKGWRTVAKEVFCLPTGPEGLMAIDLPAEDVKCASVELEQQSAAGRLWDIDVIGKNGILSRQALGLGPRRCLVCERDARICARERTHSLQALNQAMEALFL